MIKLLGKNSSLKGVGMVKSKHFLYQRWSDMHRRCYNPKRKDYKHYGGRGISVCQRWTGNLGFEFFLEDMEGSFSDGLELDRIDVNGNYCPENCKWSSRREQVINRRGTGSPFDTRFITYNDKTMCLSQWADELGIDYRILIDRFHHGWPTEKVFTFEQRVKKVSLEIAHNSLALDDVFLYPTHLYPKAKKHNIKVWQYVANLLYDKGKVFACFSNEKYEVTPTANMSSELKHFKLKVGNF